MGLTISVSAAAFAISAVLVAGGSMPDCSISCFDQALETYYCGDLQSHTHCCGYYYFITGILASLLHNCSAGEDRQAWNYIEEQCSSLNSRVPWSYEEILSDQYGINAGKATEFPSTDFDLSSAATTTTSETHFTTTESPSDIAAFSSPPTVFAT
ncbi:hypothetical protein AJ79_03647 [Helicocarpus griseus UAMH5409]|uniref:CFEM domain-containing protein n=1 Tax=Helicocarpus griseus UAMH5409 TaxID=1447875 RepID=A0A2B7XWE2_9EURO|nr:hypothetical protein AJ79_03647 [Helicocarpus griseus UAMH5409]